MNDFIKVDKLSNQKFPLFRVMTLSANGINQKTLKMNIEKIISEKQGTIVDVRTPVEFMAGNVKGSVNIPLREIPNRIEELKNFRQPLVLCCASGARSEQATQILSRQGINCFNGGSWLNVNYHQSQTV